MYLLIIYFAQLNVFLFMCLWMLCSVFVECFCGYVHMSLFLCGIIARNIVQCRLLSDIFHVCCCCQWCTVCECVVVVVKGVPCMLLLSMVYCVLLVVYCCQ